MEFSDIQKMVYQTSLEHGWHDKNITFGNFIALTHSELSKALQEYRKCGYTSDEVKTKLADVVIRIIDWCGYYDVDLEKSILEKICIQ